jgi:hypothetical protein
MMKFLFSFCVLILAGATLWPVAARAQQNDAEANLALKKPTSSRDVGVLFFRMAGIAPDFAQLLPLDAAITRLPEEERAKAIEKDKLSLDVQYANLEPKKTQIVIRSAVRVWPSHGDQQGLKVEFPKTDMLYFPYNAFGQDIAIIPNALDSYAYIPQDTTESRISRSKLDLGGAATLVLVLQPIAADMKTPVVLDNLPQWPLLTEIAFFGIYNKRMQAIWSEKAPWFKDEQGDIFTLKQGEDKAEVPAFPSSP